MAGMNKLKGSYKEIKDKVNRLKKAEEDLEALNPSLEYRTEVESIKARLKTLSQVEQVEQELANLKYKMGIGEHRDVFISYSSYNSTVADAVCAALEENEIRCWVAHRDVFPGDDWAGSIIRAIESVRIMVVILSDHANRSRQMLREVSKAVDEGIIIIPFRIEEVALSDNLSYYLATCHWLNALKLPLEQHIDELADTIKHILTTGIEKTHISHENGSS